MYYKTWTLNYYIFSGLPCIKLQIRLSQFWRHQKGSPRWFLATIEAIHQLLVEFTETDIEANEPPKNYDNMLFFFRFMYEKIHQLYEHDELKSYRRPVNIWNFVYKKKIIFLSKIYFFLPILILKRDNCNWCFIPLDYIYISHPITFH